MSGSYNLRRKKGISVQKCHLRCGESRLPPDFNPVVRLERLKLLERNDVTNCKFYQKNGKILKKENNSFYIRFWWTLLFIIVLVIAAMYWKDELQRNNIKLIQKFEIPEPVQRCFSTAFKFTRNILKRFDYSQSKHKSGHKKASPVIPKENNMDEIRFMIREHFAEMKKKNKIHILRKSPDSFIEEQCKTYAKGYGTIKRFFNSTSFDGTNLTDFALESEGAKIVTVYDTQPYSIITVKFFNFKLWPEFSRFLFEYLKSFHSNGPNSVLLPWKKPGDCWAFKGSSGRIQIKLSQEILITAVSIDHIPKKITPEGYAESAPKEFSVLGVEKSGNQTYLGSYEYKNTGPSIQTFLVQSRVEIHFRGVEVIIESNHGNKQYTCVYKIRVHGHI